MTFTQAIASGFRRYLDFRTRSSRSEYWWWTLFSALTSVLTMVLDEVLFGGTAILNTLNAILLFIPGLAVAIRRLHDTDRSGWWLLIALGIIVISALIYWALILIGILLLIYWYVQPGTAGSNRYGYNPLRSSAVSDFVETGHISRTPSRTGFCPDCGTTLEANDNFCHSCGISI